MPIDISMDETTMSIIKKGINIKKPISKARRNSDIINAGISMRMGISLAASLSEIFAISANRAISCSRTWDIMNTRNGSIVRLKDSNSSISPSISGLMPASKEASKVGIITNRVRNNARLINT